MKRLVILLALVVVTLNGCFIEAEHDRGDNERHQRHHGDEDDDNNEHKGNDHGYH